MAKGILKFNLPEEQLAYLNAVYGSRYFSTLLAVDERLRLVLKHSDCSDDAKKLSEEIREMIREDLSVCDGW